MAMRALTPAPVETSPTLKAGIWLFRFVFALVVDGWEGLSMTRFLAMYFASLVGYSVRELHGVISGNALWLALAAAAIAFGKSTFTFLLRRISLTSSSVDVNVNATVREIQERRQAGGGLYEPTHE